MSLRLSESAMHGAELRTRAEKDTAALPPSVARRVLDAIAGLDGNQRPPGIRELEVERGYRIRLGDYRIVFEIDDDARRVIVVRARRRRHAHCNIRYFH